MSSQAAPWLARLRCYPSGQIPSIRHGFFETALAIPIAGLNREPQPSRDTITGNVPTLTTREDINQRCSEEYFTNEVSSMG